MKTLVLFASKHGCTEKCARLLAQKVGAEVVDLGKKSTVSLEEYDTVLIGSSVYVGQISKAVSGFCSANVAALTKKRIGLFVCCGQTEKAIEQLEAAFPKELVEAAVAKGHFGYDFTKLGFVEKLIAKGVGAPVGTSNIRNTEIETFAEMFGRGA